MWFHPPEMLLLGVVALMVLSVSAHDDLVMANPARYAPSHIETSRCSHRTMNADTRTWKGDAQGMTVWWRAVPSKFQKADYQEGFKDLEELQAEVDKYQQVIAEIRLRFQDSFEALETPDCESIFAWQLMYIDALFKTDETTKWNLPENAHSLPLKLANTHTDIFSMFGPTEDEYTTAWFAAYDLFGYPQADPSGEPLYPNRETPGKGTALVAGAVAGAVLAPVLLSAAGFTAAGVTAGSVAAGVQSVVYGGAATGAFSLLQSAGTGAIGSLVTVMGGAAAVGGGVVSSVMTDSSSSSQENEDE